MPTVFVSYGMFIELLLPKRPVGENRMFITLPLPKRSIRRKPMEGSTRWVWTHSRGALMGVAVLTACGGSPFEPELGVADFDVVWEEVESRYPHFQLKGIDWSSLRAYTPRRDLSIRLRSVSWSS